MSRPERPSRADLPGADIPSAEVLDELLRAFSVEVTSSHRLDHIDLTSPEVEELLSAPADDDALEVAEAPTTPDATPSEPTPAEPRTSDPAPPAGDGAAADPATAADGDPATPAEPVVDVPEVVPDVEPGDSETATGSDNPEPVVEVEAPGPSSSSDPPGTTIVIADDDLPDAVYLGAAGDPLIGATMGAAARQPALSAEPESGELTRRVFIDDQATGGIGETISLEDATSATRIEPRLRERRIAVRRAVGRKRLKWALVVVLVVGVVVGALAVLGSGWFAIDDVEVEGAVYTDPVALQAVIDELVGTPVLRADTNGAERSLEAIAWVEDARVTTDFPHGVKIEIRERAPAVAFAGPDGAYRVIDAHGRVLDVLASQPVEYLPLTSDDPPELVPGQFAPQGFSAAASLAQALTPEMRQMAQSVAVTPDGSDLRLTIAPAQGPPIEVRFGVARDLVTKLVRLQTWLDRLDNRPISYIDVSTNEVTTG